MNYNNYYGRRSAHYVSELRRSKKRMIASVLGVVLLALTFLYFEFPTLIRAAIEGRPAFAEPVQGTGPEAEAVAQGVEHVALSAWIFAGVLVVGAVFFAVVFFRAMHKYRLLKKTLDPAVAVRAEEQAPY